jgi:hypothetical protein
VVSFGPFISALLTPYTRVELSGGPQFTSFQARQSGVNFGATVAGTIPQQSTSAPGYHFTCTITNRLNASFTHALSFGHERELAFGADFVDRNFANYNVTWHMTRNIYLVTALFYENGTAVNANLREKFDRFGLSTSFGYALTRHLTVALRYVYTQKTSDLDFRDYVQNVLGVTLSYDF